MFKPKKLLICIPVFVLFLVLFSGFANAEGNRVGTVTCSMLNVRELPDTSAKILVQIPQGTKVKVLENSADWCKINYNNSTGWVYGQYLSIRDEAIGKGTINASNVNVRTGPDLSSEIITRLNKGDTVDVFDRSGDWYRIQIPEEKFGWVHKDLILVREVSASRGIVDDAAPKVEDPENKDADAIEGEEKTTGEKIIEYAKKFLGVRYVYGGASPSGFDCSGFVSYVFKNFDISLQRTAASQSQRGEAVKKEDLKMGDLVFFDTNGGRNSIEHVGIYIADGKFIHASSGRSTRKVVISDMSEGFYKDTYMKARRYIK